MNWTILIPIIVQHGLPFAEKLIEKWSTGGVPTLADLQELKALAAQSAASIMTARLIAAGIDPTSAQGKTLLGLAG